MKRGLFAAFIFLSAVTFAQEEEMRAARREYFDGGSETALEKYKDISKQFKDRDAFLNAAFIAMELGRPKDCADIAQAGLKIFPRDAKLLEFLGEAYLADGQFLAAEKIFAALLDNQEKQNLFYIDMARSQTGLGEDGLAIQNLTAAAAGDTLLSYSNYKLGALYEGKEDYKKAALHFGKAVTYDSQFTEARLHYAMALEKLDDVNEAWKQYRAVYTADKTVTAAKTAMDALAPKLTKPQKEILQPKEILEHTAVKSLVSEENGLPFISVGLGAKADGSPSIRQNVFFVPGADFEIISDGKVIARGKAGETWEARLISGKAYLIPPQGEKINFKNSVLIKPKPDAVNPPTIILRKMMTGAAMTWASEDDKEYRGVIEIIHNAALKTLVPVNRVNIEEYTAGVLASEMPLTFPEEALRAQAVLARTFALKRKGHHKKYGYDVCDMQHCQVYGGVQAERERTSAVVKATEGVILTYKSKPVEAVFSANCGGLTQSSKNAGWYEYDYLTVTNDYKNLDLENLQPYRFKELLQHPQDAYSRYNKFVSPASFRWARVVQEKDLREIIKRNRRDIGQITGIIPYERALSGYVSKVRVTGTKGSVELTKENSIKSNLSLGMLRSTYFTVQPVYVDKELKEFVFFGGGWGHGVGFCQTGAAGRAEEGQKYDEIISHYYPGTQLKNLREN